MAHLQPFDQTIHVLAVIILIQQLGIFFNLHALVDVHGGVAAVIDDQIRSAAVGP